MPARRISPVRMKWMLPEKWCGCELFAARPSICRRWPDCGRKCTSWRARASAWCVAAAAAEGRSVATASVMRATSKWNTPKDRCSFPDISSKQIHSLAYDPSLNGLGVIFIWAPPQNRAGSEPINRTNEMINAWIECWLITWTADWLVFGWLVFGVCVWTATECRWRTVPTGWNHSGGGNWVQNVFTDDLAPELVDDDRFLVELLRKSRLNSDTFSLIE